MFDLEQEIKAWRRRMLAAGLKGPIPLDEFESHLRDDVEQQVRAGAEPRHGLLRLSVLSERDDSVAQAEGLREQQRGHHDSQQHHAIAHGFTVL